MSLKEFVAHEVESLDEKELQAVAEYVSFLKFRSRFARNETAADEASLASLYHEFADEDRELAEVGIADYARSLTREDKA